ncbi:hypothetical protein ACSHT0_15290 [Tepidicaulis sp. LMO-SS28]|uniref:hypothetical protein n=1 Tax=Tepidicaulis sp. LMO-SS28 TaxID=3447455 RepID=UPI003EE39EE5
MPRTAQKAAPDGQEGLEFSLCFTGSRLELKVKEPYPSNGYRTAIYDSSPQKSEIVRAGLFRFLAEMVFTEQALQLKDEKAPQPH